jgi:hypothetical protein
MKKKRITYTVCDNLQWKRNKRSCVTNAIWGNLDKFTARVIIDRRRN